MLLTKAAVLTNIPSHTRCVHVYFLLHVCGAAATSASFCGTSPQMTDPSTVQWSNPPQVNHSYVEVRKVNNIGNQTECNSDGVTSFEVFSFNTANYTFPSIDYDSLYIAKVRWPDYSDIFRQYYLRNSECYFIPQRREYSHI